MKTTKRYYQLALISSGLLAIAISVGPAQAQSSAKDVILQGHDFAPGPTPGVWSGTLTLTMDGTDYSGNGEWWVTDIRFNPNNMRWFASGVYTFGELGSITIWENGRWDLAEPKVGLSGMNRIVDGTGVFAGARGSLQMVVYTHHTGIVNFVAAGHLVLPPGTAR